MYRFGVVSAKLHQDWMSKELLRAGSKGHLAQEVDLGKLVADVSKRGMRLRAARDLTSFDALILRRLDQGYESQVQLELLAFLAARGVLIVNSPQACVAAESKFLSTLLFAQARLSVPRTLVTSDFWRALEWAREHEDVLIKPNYGSRGEDIMRLRSPIDRKQLRAAYEAQGYLYLQQYVPGGESDFRAFVVGERVVAAIRRQALPGEWRTNIAAGGAPEAVHLPPSMCELALQAARAVGLDYAGVDILVADGRPYLLEVNGSPSWMGMEEATGRDVARDIVDYVVELLELGRSPIGGSSGGRAGTYLPVFTRQAEG